MPDRPHYLYSPLPGDQGAHGRFDGEASPRSPMLWAVKHREALAGAGLAALAGSVAAAFSARR